MKSRVLIIDGSLPVRIDLRAALASAGLVATACESGASALKLLRGHRFSLVILDPAVAGGDPTRLVTELRSTAEHASVPVLLLGDEAEAKRWIEGDRSGADAFVAKPYEPGALVRRVQGLVARAPQKSEPGATQTCCRKILAVDDSPTFRETLTQALRADGFDVVAARSAEEALERLASGGFDCVIMDLVMPGMGGMEGARRIKTSPAFRHIPVMILTGEADEAIRLEGARIGVDDFVLKSPELPLLRVHIRAVFRKKRLEREQGLGQPAEAAPRGPGLRRPPPSSLFGRVIAASGLSDMVGATTIRRACERAGVDPQTMTPVELERALPVIQDAIRVFLPVPEHQRRVVALADVVRASRE